MPFARSSRRRTSVVFLLLVTVAVLVIVGHNFYRYYIDRNYVITAITACDPSAPCFQMDSENADPNFQIPLYSKVEVDAADAPHCLDEHACTDFSCAGARHTCMITYCSADTTDDGESCVSAQP